MQSTIEEKVNEVSVDQKLAALKEISDQKDMIDRKITELNYNRGQQNDLPLQIHLIFSHGDEFIPFELNLPETPASMITQIVDTYLKSRREELISHAQRLMK